MNSSLRIPAWGPSIAPMRVFSYSVVAVTVSIYGPRFLKVLVLALMLIGSASSAWGQSDGRIAGRVINQAGAAIQGVSVQAYRNNTFVASANTDASGNYVIASLTTGSYNVRTFNTLTTGYIDHLYASPQVQCHNCNTTAGTLIAVTAGVTTPNINFALNRGGFITGTVTNTSSVPVAGVTVQIFHTLNTNATAVLASLTTDSSGAYKSRALPSGSYFVRTSANSHGLINQLYDNINCLGCAVSGGTPVSVTAPASVSSPVSTSHANFRLPPGGAITGTVKMASTSAGIAGVTVNLHNSAGVLVQSTTTSSNGTYTLGGIANGSYYVRTTDAGAANFVDQVYAASGGVQANQSCLNCNVVALGTLITVFAPGTATGIDFPLVTGGSIAGSTTRQSDGSPISGQIMFLHNSAGTQISLRTTDASGAYVFAGLPTGTYYLRSSANLGNITVVYDGDDIGTLCLGCTPMITTMAAPVLVTVGSATGNKNLQLTPGQSVTGRVATAGGVPIGAGVILYTSTGTAIAMGNGLLTNNLGRYSYTGLPAGVYYARTTNSLGFLNQLYSGIVCAGCDSTSGTPIVLGDSAPATADFTLSPGGRVSGTITDAATAAPVGGVQVSIYDAAGTLMSSATSDDAGRFVTWSGLPSGTYFAQAVGTGYISQLYSAIDCNTTTCSPASGSPIQVTAGTVTADINFPMVAGGTVSGVVSDSDVTSGPSGIENVTVAIHEALTGTLVRSAITTASGAFSIGGVPTGAYVARTTNSVGFVDEIYDNLRCAGCPVTSGRQFFVTTGNATTGIDFALSRGGSLTGQVQADGGALLSGVTVLAFDTNNRLVGSALTNESGNYVFIGLAPGTYFVRTAASPGGHVNELYPDHLCVTCNASLGAPITVTAGATTTAIDFRLAPGGAITGHVRGVASPSPTSLPNVTVSAFDANDGFVGSALTNALGFYTLSGLPPGSYHIRTTNSHGYADQIHAGIPCSGCAGLGSTPVAVTAGATTGGIDFTLALGGSIGGTVTNSLGAPLGGIAIQVWLADDRLAKTTSTRADGTYRVIGLAPGRYFVRTANTLGYVDQMYRDITCLGCSPMHGQAIVVTEASSTTGIDFVLAVGGVVSGRVTTRLSNLPIGNVTVNVYTAAGALVATGVTNGNGTYRTGTMPAGPYYARTASSGGYIDQLYNGRDCTNCNPTGGALVTVTAGGNTSGIDFSLAAGGRVRGTVMLESGGPAAGVSVGLYSRNGALVTTALVDSQGQYVTIGGLPSGDYYARTSNSEGLIEQLFNDIICTNCSVSTGQPITVTTGADATGIDFVLSHGGRISGTVTDSSSPPAPVPFAYVTVHSRYGKQVAEVTADAFGRYVTSGLPRDLYFVRASGRNLVQAVYKTQPVPPHNVNCVACTPLTGSPVLVQPGLTTSGIDFSLQFGGAISGSVVDAETGAPISGVLVWFHDERGTALGFTVTEASGRYQSGVGWPAGTYYARTANDRGYTDQVYRDTTCIGCSVRIAGTPFVITGGATTEGIDFSLSRGGRIRGTVTDAAGIRLSGMTVVLVAASGRVVAQAVSDNNGEYASIGLPAGIYFAQTIAQSGYLAQLFNSMVCRACDVRRGTPITVTAGNTTNLVDFVLQFGGEVSGRVTSTESSTNLRDVEVSLHTGHGALVARERTNGAGIFRLSGIPAGSYLLRTTNVQGYIDEAYDNKRCAPCPLTATDATAVTVTARSTTADVNFGLDTGGLVTGLVTDSTTGAPLEGVTVFFFQNGVLVGRSAGTNDQGFYAISLPVGTYTVVTGHVNGYAQPTAGPGAIRTAASTTVTVAKGEETSAVSFPLAACTPPTVSPTSLPIMTAGQPYSHTISASGGAGPYTFSISSGSMAPGLTLNASTGVISGTPTVSGTANFTVAAADSGGCAGTTDYTPFVCGVNVNTTQVSYTSVAGSGSLSLAANSTDCSWTASTDASWVTLGASSGTGSATVAYTVGANASPNFRTGTITIGGNAVTITQGGATTLPPFGSFDTPSGTTTISGSVAVSGWALDDLGVSRVELWRDRVAGETTPVYTGAGPGNGKIYIADMLFVSGARPDVAAAFASYPFANRAGWGYLMLTQGLWNQGNGAYTLYAFAYDQEGKVTTLGSKTITVDNANAVKPFGSIDTPTYGQTTSGSFWNFGWALTPGSTCVVTNGNVFMSIDSGTLIPVNYGDTRTDIAAVFSGFTNGSSAGGAFYLDTTTLTDGAHQIGWYVVDSCNRAEGIGSRFFTVANGMSGVVIDPPPNVIEASQTAPVEGLTASRVAETVSADEVSVEVDGGVTSLLAADDQGWRTITLRQNSRIAVRLPAGLSYTAYQLANGERTALPIGSSFDDAAGVFGWEPAPGYLGSFDLVFVAADGSAIPITVIVNPLQH